MEMAILCCYIRSKEFIVFLLTSFGTFGTFKLSFLSKAFMDTFHFLNFFHLLFNFILLDSNDKYNQSKH